MEHVLCHQNTNKLNFVNKEFCCISHRHIRLKSIPFSPDYPYNSLTRQFWPLTGEVNGIIITIILSTVSGWHIMSKANTVSSQFSKSNDLNKFDNAYIMMAGGLSQSSQKSAALVVCLWSVLVRREEQW